MLDAKMKELIAISASVAVTAILARGTIPIL
jgi:hypothetical protein